MTLATVRKIGVLLKWLTVVVFLAAIVRESAWISIIGIMLIFITFVWFVIKTKFETIVFHNKMLRMCGFLVPDGEEKLVF